MRQPQHQVLASLALLAVLSLTACGGQHDELQAWMDQQRQEVKPNIQPLTEPRKFNPQAYAGMDSEEPFSQSKLSGALKSEATQPNS
ncbi:MAG: pilus assembly protein PilP, partial [Aquabacterium sp.]